MLDSDKHSSLFLIDSGKKFYENCPTLVTDVEAIWMIRFIVKLFDKKSLNSLERKMASRILDI
jgi:hypothetical protein